MRSEPCEERPAGGRSGLCGIIPATRLSGACAQPKAEERVAKEKLATDISLAEAASRYVGTLSPNAAQESQAAISRFVQWFGTDKRLANLTTVDVERFV